MICSTFGRISFTRASLAAPLLSSLIPTETARAFSNNNRPSKGKTSGFRPKRRPDPKYRPVVPGAKKIRDPIPGNNHKFVDLGAPAQNPKDDLDASLGPLAGDFVRHLRKERTRALENHRLEDDSVDESLRMVDYYLSQRGSIEDLVGERRALATDFDTEEERETFLAELERIEEEDRNKDMSVENQSPTWLNKVAKKASTSTKLYSRFSEDDDAMDDGTDEDKDPDVYLDPNQLAHGDWSEMLIQVDRNVKLWRGGRLESYRALVIGGNLNGCGGFGIGKSTDPIEAVNKASRICKRNIFFVERYQGNGLTRDLAGKQNSCKLIIRATDNGLRGNELVREILKRFGITNAVAKAHGNRSVYNVVHATFKALMTHESLEDIALKRGKRIVSLDRAMRLQI
jgi:small subunit ribosomal protein S5